MQEDGAPAPAPARILIADDDPAARRVMRLGLARAGHFVEEAADGNEALAAVARSCPDVLIADVVMPGLNGQELADRCRQLCNRTILIFVSGYTARQLQELDITQVVFLEKPVSVRELVNTVERLRRAQGAAS